jgi:16S rRNA (uracil1498-N3)-methyltransferase
VTHTFYAPRASIRGGRITLPEDEARHATRVLRLREGDDVAVVDGEGGWYRVVLDAVGRQAVHGHVVDSRREVGEPPYRLRIAMAIIKSHARFETFLEKSAELGVDSVIPMITDRTEKGTIRDDRSKNVLVAAMKQCGRSRLVRLEPPVSFEEVLRRPHNGLGLCCHEQADPGLFSVLQEFPAAPEILVMVGPEGGFTEAEVRMAQDAGGHVVSLGPRRLRAETAAIAAAAAVALVRDAHDSS